MTEITWEDTPAGRFRAALGVAAPPQPTAEQRAAAMEAERAAAADAWARYGRAIPPDAELASRAEARAAAVTRLAGARPERPVDVGELVTKCGYGIRPAVAPCGQRHAASRQHPDGLWRFIGCDCLDVPGTDAWRARMARAEAEGNRRHAVVPPTAGDDW